MTVGRDDEADLVTRLMSDPGARPQLSLMAFIGDRAVGPILFTRASLERDQGKFSLYLLASLSVAPQAQRNVDAWMVQALRKDVLGSVSGTVVCADALDRPECRRE